MGEPVRRGVAAALLTAPVLAVAHHAEGYLTPQTFASGLLSGLAHPAIEVGQVAFLIALGVYCARWPAGGRTILWFAVGSALGVLLAAAGALLPAERLLPLALLGIAGALAFRGDGAPAGIGAPIAIGLTSLAGLVHGQAAIEPMAVASLVPFGAYAVAMLCAQILIVLLARAVIARLLPANARTRRRSWRAAAAASGVAAVAVALQPGLSFT